MMICTLSVNKSHLPYPLRVKVYISQHSMTFDYSSTENWSLPNVTPYTRGVARVKLTVTNPGALLCVPIAAPMVWRTPKVRYARDILSQKFFETFCTWCILRSNFLLFLVFFEKPRLVLLMPGWKRNKHKKLSKNPRWQLPNIHRGTYLGCLNEHYTTVQIPAVFVIETVN